MKILTGLKYFYKRLFSKNEGEYAGFVLAEKISGFLHPRYKFSEFGRIWLNDKDFFTYYERFDDKNYHSADRKYFLKSLLDLADGIEGELAECGVYKGASAWLICDHFRKSGKIFYGFDSFEGLSKPAENDSEYWTEGDLKAGEDVFKNNLAEFAFARARKGWIPETFKGLENEKFCFAHVDVDLYQPTLDSLRFFYPKMSKGGIILFDDYGFASCAGAKKAVDEFMTDKAEKLINVPTGQAFIIKK